MSTELLTPINATKGEIVDLARRKFKKQILPITEVKYGGKQKKFDMSYLRTVKESFDAGAFPYIPLKLAPGDNSHTNDVLRTGGKLAGLELSDSDGLIGVFELNDDGYKAVESSDGHVGVSARIFENVEQPDGRAFAAAMQHVLVTDDPHVQGMKPWEAVSLSADREGVTETIDLSAAEYLGASEGSMNDTKVTLELTAEQRDTLLQLAADHEDVKALNLKPEDFTNAENGGEGDGLDDEDDDEDDDGTGTVTLSRHQTEAIELARATAEAAQNQVVELSRQLNSARVEREIAEFQGTGLAPAIIDAARPLLEGASQIVELSNGKKTDSATVMRNVLREVVELARTGHDILDLDTQSGVLIGTDSVQKQRDAMLAAARQYD